MYNTMAPNDKVLLISNSTVYGRGYLDHVESEIRSFLGSAQRVLFFPFALYDRDSYTATARSRFDAMGYSHRIRAPGKESTQSHQRNRRDFCRRRQHLPTVKSPSGS